MPRSLPGARDAGETEPSFSVSAVNFSNTEMAVLLDFITTWQAAIETGARPFLSPLAAYLNLPRLRAFWPLSSVDENNDLYDVSGQGRTLTHNTTLSHYFYVRNFTPTVALVSAAQTYLSRGHEAGLSLTGDLSFGLWVKPYAGTVDAMIMGKAGPAGNVSWELHLEGTATTPYFRFYVSADGTNTVYSTQTPAVMYDTWHLLVAVYDASTNPYLYRDGRAPTGPPSGPSPGALFSTAQPLVIGHANNPAATYLDGEIALPFLCAHALPIETVRALYNTTRNLLP